jgi:copper chaperone CopZ
MKKISIDLPTMYGDHHVVEVRRLLFDLNGVEEVYASSGFQVIEVSFDGDKVDQGQIEDTLKDAGYIGELGMPVEVGVAAQELGGKAYFRHTAAYEQTRQVVGFSQQVPFAGRPLWPCPGFGPIQQVNGEEEE